MRVRDIMQGPVEALRKDATLRDAAFLFRRQRVQGARVMDAHGELSGIFTHEELLQALANGASMSDAVAGHARSVFCTVHPDTDISEIDWQGSRFLAVLDADAVVGGIDTVTVLEAAYGARQSGDLPYHQIFQGLPEPVFLVDSLWSVGWHNVAAGLLCSRASMELCGLKLADVLRKSGFELEVDPADGQSIHMAWRDSVRLLPIIWRANNEDRPMGFMVLLRNVQDQMGPLARAFGPAGFVRRTTRHHRFFL